MTAQRQMLSSQFQPINTLLPEHGSEGSIWLAAELRYQQPFAIIENCSFKVSLETEQSNEQVNKQSNRLKAPLWSFQFLSIHPHLSAETGPPRSIFPHAPCPSCFGRKWPSNPSQSERAQLGLALPFVKRLCGCVRCHCDSSQAPSHSSLRTERFSIMASGHGGVIICYKSLQ